MILSTSMMLDWLAERHHDRHAAEGAKRIEQAVRRVLHEHQVITRDLGGTASTVEVARAVANALED